MQNKPSSRPNDHLQILPSTLLVSIMGWLALFPSPHPARGQSAAAPLRMAEGAAADPQQPPEPARAIAKMIKGRIAPHWLEDDRAFWYRNNLHGDACEFIRVDTEAGTRQAAFDHRKLAEALRAAGLPEMDEHCLPLDRLDFGPSFESMRFRCEGKHWQCDLVDYTLEEITGKELTDADDGWRAQPLRRLTGSSTRTGGDTELTFVNQTEGTVELFWIDGNGQRQSYGNLKPDERRDQHTFAGHLWAVVGDQGRTIAAYRAADQPQVAEITGESPPIARRRNRSRPDNRSDDRSPDGKWNTSVRDGNLVLLSTEDDGERVLTEDGSPERRYQMINWSPNSKYLAAFRVTPGEQEEVHLVESSPADGNRARLHSRPYALPGDRFAKYELRLFDVASGEAISTDVEPIDFGRPRIRWYDEGSYFTFERVDRGHRRFRIVKVISDTGETHSVIDERSETFIWTAHGPRITTTSYLQDQNALIYVSERDGWRHLDFVDLDAGELRHRITEGEWVVRGIDSIDEENRQIWFHASGMHADQDPYFLHHLRIDFDGSGMVALTAGNGDHSIDLSPTGRFLIDRYSRVNEPPIHELRRTDDGSLVCELERADIRGLLESGWQAPEVFNAKGRDGETDIWGILCKPKHFDPEKQYPVIEAIYAGPHDSHVPKSFRASDWHRPLTDLGFVVVQIDGMGTANRSKAFHDVCWENLKDAGFPDRIRWIKAAGEKFPFLDTDRVGIYGTSAGGQNAAGAVLFHPDFYKVAVASCGCHDNRLDKASWNEQWMGYPVGPHYAACSNVENADRLEGKLFLIVGEMDRNVPPESTYRFVDALIKADKDFDLLVLPGAGHTDGGNYGRRKMREFFIRHLK